MTHRNPKLAALLNALEEILLQSDAPAALKARAGQVLRTLDTPFPNAASLPARLEACANLAAAVDGARQGGSDAVVRAAESLSDLDPLLPWTRRPNSAASGMAFHNHHANAMLIGPGGLEQRSDIWLGVSLVAPEIHYPFHKHPPNELYLVLSDSEWYREDRGWFAPGIGGYVHNSPNQEHAMRAKDKPLLAFWLLWSDAGPVQATYNAA